jgi:glycosyl hydrolase family 42 (putative beta-galactosidase)
MDYCFCPHTLRAFREWLKAQYGSLDALNREWGSSFAGWDAVVPQDTYEAKAAEQAALASGKPVNYAPWADHKAYMDASFAAAIDRLRQMLHEVDPGTPVGITGTTMPAAWGGYDLWRLATSVDLIEPYDAGTSREILASFLKSGTPVMSTVFGSDFERIRRGLWWRLLAGDRGVVIWDDESSRVMNATGKDLAVTERGRELRPILAEIQAMAPKLSGLRPEDDRIAIHYSQASVRAHWMFDSREDGKKWPRRLASYEQANSRLARLRDSFVRLVEDSGFTATFVSYEQVENDELLKGGYRVLILPQSVAMSGRESERIRAFVKAGGTVIADSLAGMMDEHGKWLPKGQLDDLFGIEYKSGQWHPAGAGGEFSVKAAADPLIGFDRDLIVKGADFQRTASGAPVIVMKKTGAGNAVYLNLDMRNYWSARLKGGAGENYLDLMQRLLAAAGLRAPIAATDAATHAPVRGLRVFRYTRQDSRYVALMRSPELELSALGRPELSNAEFEKPARIHVVFPREAKITDMRENHDFAVTSAIDVNLDAWSPVVLDLGRNTDISSRK